MCHPRMHEDLAGSDSRTTMAAAAGGETFSINNVPNSPNRRLSVHNNRFSSVYWQKRLMKQIGPKSYYVNGAKKMVRPLSRFRRSIFFPN